MNILGLNIRRNKKVQEEQRSTNYYGGDALLFGQLLNQNASMSISAVYRATEMISDAIATLPINIKIEDGNDSKILGSHSLYGVFYDKSALISKYNFMKLLIQSVILKGNGYAYIERNGDGSVKSLRFLDNNDVVIYYDKHKNTLKYQSTLVSKKYIESCNMIHLVKNSYDGVQGISVISFANRAIGNANATEDSAKSFFENGCNLSGVLKVQGQLSQQQRNDIRTSWNQAYTGGNNGLAILQGNMEYQPIQINSRDAQLIESRQFNVQDIARFFGISPFLLGENSGASYGSLEQAQNQFILQTLQPYISMVEEEFSRKLLKPSEGNMYVELDSDYLLKTNKTEQATYYSTLVQNGILSINEVRQAIGYNSIEGGDAHTIAYSDVNQNKIDKDKEE